MSDGIKHLLARLMGLLAVLAGGGVGCCAAYGPVVPDPDPQVEIVDFSYQPATTARTGDELIFSVTINQAIRPGYRDTVNVLVGDGGTDCAFDGFKGCYVPAADDGIAPDSVAGDLIYTGAWEVPDYLLPQSKIPVVARYGWERDGGPYLRILPEEDV